MENQRVRDNEEIFAIRSGLVGLAIKMISRRLEAVCKSTVPVARIPRFYRLGEQDRRRGGVLCSNP